MRRFGRSADYAIIQTTAAESLHLDSDRFPARHAARERLPSGQTWRANGVTVLYRVWRTHLFTKPGAGRVLQTRFHAEETCLAVKPRPRRRPAGPRVVVLLPACQTCGRRAWLNVARHPPGEVMRGSEERHLVLIRAFDLFNTRAAPNLREGGKLREGACVAR